jgi:hypothetical protein
MTRAEQFRQSTENFWSKMDQIGNVVVADVKPKATSSGNLPSKQCVGPAARKPKKRNKR